MRNETNKKIIHKLACDSSAARGLCELANVLISAGAHCTIIVNLDAGDILSANTQRRGEECKLRESLSFIC